MTTLSNHVLRLIHEQPGITYAAIEAEMKIANVTPRDVYVVVAMHRRNGLISGSTVGSTHGFYTTPAGLSQMIEIDKSAKVDAAFDKQVVFAVVLGLALIAVIVALFKNASAFN